MSLLEIPAHYISGYQILEEGKLSGLMQMIRKEVVAKKCTLLVLDGYILTEELKESELASKKTIHKLQAFAALVGCTVILLTIKERGARRPHPGYTMVDGIVELMDSLVGLERSENFRLRNYRVQIF